MPYDRIYTTRTADNRVLLTVGERQFVFAPSELAAVIAVLQQEAR